MSKQFIVRNATQSDQTAINDIIHQANLNPSDLNWQRFVVAESNGKIIGTGQIRMHKDGSRELASIATLPDYQNLGIATEIIQTLLARESVPLYLMCEEHNETFYQRFNFKRLTLQEMPPYFRRMIYFSKPAIVVYCLVKRIPLFELLVMKQQV